MTPNQQDKDTELCLRGVFFERQPFFVYLRLFAGAPVNSGWRGCIMTRQSRGHTAFLMPNLSMCNAEKPNAWIPEVLSPWRACLGFDKWICIDFKNLRTHRSFGGNVYNCLSEVAVDRSVHKSMKISLLLLLSQIWQIWVWRNLSCVIKKRDSWSFPVHLIGWTRHFQREIIGYEPKLYKLYCVAFFVA